MAGLQTLPPMTPKPVSNHRERIDSKIAFFHNLIQMPPDSFVDMKTIMNEIRSTNLLLVGKERVESGDERLYAQFESFLAQMTNDKVTSTAQFKRMVELVKLPWTGTDIVGILQANGNVEPTEFFVKEEPDLISHRLTTLCESKMFRIAFNLSLFFVKNYEFDFQNPVDKTVSQIVALHVGLMVKLKNTASAQVLIDRLNLEYIFNAIRSLEDNSPWKRYFSDKLYNEAIYVLLRCAISVLSREPIVEDQTSMGLLAKELVKLNADDFNSLLEAFFDECTESVLFYSIAMALWNEKRDDNNHLRTVLRLFSHGLSFDLNQMEAAASKKDENLSAKIEKKLHEAFLKLSCVIKKYSDIFYRESLLSAFSLSPSSDLFEKVRECAPKTAETINEGKGKEEENGEAESKQFMAMKTSGDFEKTCSALQEDLEKIVAKKKESGHLATLASMSYNDALLSIQGSVLTSKEDYNPLAEPLKPFDMTAFGIPTELSSNLVVAINAARWHMLSWALNWPELEERCQKLLQNPTIKYPPKELKYLVIDYTQFDEWSSEEELDTSTGIEKGYELMADSDDGE